MRNNIDIRLYGCKETERERGSGRGRKPQRSMLDREPVVRPRASAAGGWAPHGRGPKLPPQTLGTYPEKRLVLGTVPLGTGTGTGTVRTRARTERRRSPGLGAAQTRACAASSVTITARVCV